MSSNFKYEDIYKRLLCIAKEMNVSVRHLNLNKVLGDYCPQKRRIRIDKSLKNTKEGCKVLAHEIMHHKDYARGFFKDFFTGVPKNLKRAMQAELSASRQAYYLLLKFGLKIDYEEFDFKKNKYLISFYKEYYLK